MLSPLVRALLLGALTAAVCSIGLGPAVFGGVSDYRAHARFAASWAETGVLPVPHFGFHAIVVALHALLGADWLALSLGVVLVALGATGVIAARALDDRLGVAAAVAALALVLAGPVNLGSWDSENLYRGYIGLAVYHNPTAIVLKPLALLAWMAGARALLGQAWPVAGMALVASLAVVVKPTQAIALLPAVCLMAAWRLVRRQPIDLRALLLGLVLPTVALLLWQFAYHYAPASGTTPAGIEWAPFRAMRFRKASLPLRFVFSSLFPLTVAALFWSRLSRNVPLVLAWVSFAFGAAYAYLLSETGEWASNRNFGWSAQVTLLVLFVASAAICFEAWRAEGRAALPRLVPCAVALGLHLAGGLLFLAHPSWW